MTQTAHSRASAAEAGPFAIRSGLTITGDTQHHEFRVDRLEVLPAEPPLLEGSRLEVLDQDIDLLAQAAHDIPRPGLPQIECDRLLVARLHLPPDSRAVMHQAPFPERIAFDRRFGLDDFRAELQEQLR